MERIKSLRHKGRRHIPLPTGTYTVGCMDVMTSYFKFGVFVRLYYPSRDQKILERYLQWPLWLPHQNYLIGYAGRNGWPPRLLKLIQKIFVGELFVPAVWQASIQPAEEKYPVIIFSHGLSGWRTTYSAICLELASYGFVVAAVEHRDYSASASFYKKQARMSTIGSDPGSTLCDLDDLLKAPTEFNVQDVLDGKWDRDPSSHDIGPFCHANEWILYQNPTKENESRLRDRQVKHRAKECSQALDLLEDLNLGRYVANVLDSNFNAAMFKGHLDIKKAFFIGHSFGGATGIISLATELRYRAGILLDPWMFPFFEDESSFPLITKPFLCLLVHSFQTRQSLLVAKHLQDLHSDGKFLIMKDTDHRDLCDSPFVSRFSLSLATKFGSRIEKFSALDLSCDLILRYLGQHLGKCFRDNNRKIETLKQNYMLPDDFILKSFQ